MGPKWILTFVCIFASFNFSLAYAADDIYYDTSGSSGYDGSNGSSGSGSGGDGQDGDPGSDAKPIDLTFSEKGKNISVRGKLGNQQINKSYQNKFQYIFLFANGGSGGDGGDGGYGQRGFDGYDGRDGDDGRRGFDGRRGRDGTRFSPDGEDGERGQDGYPGEDGEDGGDAGNGYPGGHGGDGAYGGDAASIIIRYTHPESLMQITATNVGGSGGKYGSGGSGGRGGIGGDGGDGGDGGYGGRGGSGGRGYNCTAKEKEKGCRDGRDGSRGRNGYSGSDGRDGDDGRDGYSGSSGRNGSYGSDGQSGQVRYLRVDSNGKVLYESKGIYKLHLKSFGLAEENNDGIFAPWEKIWLTNIKVFNSGPIPMPKGAQLVFHLNHNGQQVVVNNLPEIAAGGTHTIKKLNLPLSGLKDGLNIRVSSALSFRNIAFDGEMAKRTFKVQYPIQVITSQFTPAISATKNGSATVELKNISRKSISTGKVAYNSTGPIQFKVAQDIKTLKAGESLTLKVNYRQSNPSKSYQDASVMWALTVDGHASGNEEYILRSVNNYQKSADADVIIIGDGMRETSFDGFTQKIKDLEFKYDYYDLDLEGAISAAQIKKYNGQIVFYPHAKQGKSGWALPALQAFVKGQGGLVAANISANLKFGDYKDVSVVTSRDILSMKLQDQLDWFSQSFPKVIPFPVKLAKLETYYNKDLGDLYLAAVQSISDDIVREFKSANAEKIYDKQAQQCFAGQFSSYADNLNLFGQFEFRTAVLSEVGDIMKVGKEDSKKGRLFMKVIRAALVGYNDMVSVEKHCGRLSGEYKSAMSEKIKAFKKSRFLGKAKPQGVLRTKDGQKFEFESKEAGNKKWTFTYKDKNGSADGVMQCDGNLVQLFWTEGNQTIEFRKYNNRTKNISDSVDTWEECYASGHWRTDKNSTCKQTYYNGCSPEEGGKQCMIL